MGKRIKYNLIYVLLGPDRSAYVGQTSDPVNRRSRYKTLTCKNQRLVYASLIEHGHDKHSFRELLVLEETATREQMDFYEKFYFSLYQELGYKMLNLKSPGWKGVPGRESRDKMSISQTGRIPWNAGTKGVCKAWNKGLSICRKKYKLRVNGEVVEISNLQEFCRNNGVNYSSMIHFLSAKGNYAHRKEFMGYERA